MALWPSWYGRSKTLRLPDIAVNVGRILDALDANEEGRAVEVELQLLSMMNHGEPVERKGESDEPQNMGEGVLPCAGNGRDGELAGLSVDGPESAEVDGSDADEPGAA